MAGSVELVVGRFSHADAFEVTLVSVVEESVKNGIGDGGGSDDFVPLLGRHLAYEQGRGDVIAVFQYFE